jgi:type IV pilus assembly protein PilA
MRAMLTKVNKTLSKQSKNNKGFSLIELIIVIAIMAALIAILAPQYLKYVEKSRISADQATAGQILSAVQVAAADVDAKWTSDAPAGTGTTVTWATDGTLSVSGTNATNLEKELATALGVTFSSDKATISKMKATSHSSSFIVELEVTSGTAQAVVNTSGYLPS